MQIDEIRVISTSKNGLFREVVAIGPDIGRRRRKQQARRKRSLTIHQVKVGDNWANPQAPQAA